ncbi:hypothetical protein EVAR_79793_1 [Eumeta japonica]|uniref:Uncharacterized protein n=1 Tax=Eumeta variegata TaxID=151549 RepID=A0A4C1WTD1_EUMVA|nr:hypothetical protein EVAR_79793_1 [Eumeta japonica]
MLARTAWSGDRNGKDGRDELASGDRLADTSRSRRGSLAQAGAGAGRSYEGGDSRTTGDVTEIHSSVN